MATQERAKPNKQWYRTDIIETVADIYEEHDAVTVPLIRTAGIPTSAVYRQFDGLAELCTEADVPYDPNNGASYDITAATDKETMVAYVQANADLIEPASVASLTEAGVSPNAIYAHFDGIEEMCAECGVTRVDQSASTEKVVSDNRRKSDTLIAEAEFDPDAPAYIYVLRVTAGDTEYFYVGSTVALETRIRTHISTNDGRAFPMDKRLVRHEYTVESIEQIVALDSDDPEHIRYAEQRVFFEVAKEHGIENVAGGK